MAVTFTPVAGYTAGTRRAWDVEFSADGDTVGTQAHGFGAAPIEVYVTGTDQAKLALQGGYTASGGAADITVGKGSIGAGSGIAGAGCRVVAIFGETH